jgi:hypothetical protein
MKGHIERKKEEKKLRQRRQAARVLLLASLPPGYCADATKKTKSVARLPLRCAKRRQAASREELH